MGGYVYRGAVGCLQVGFYLRGVVWTPAEYGGGKIAVVFAGVFVQGLDGMEEDGGDAAREEVVVNK